MKRIAIIGLGSLGGVITKHISETDFVNEIVLIDFDIVESKNVHSSIYTASQIGERKVDALAEIIENDVNVIKIKEKYKEGTTKIPKCDIVLDCRDVVCSRGNEIDIRLYISGRLLIIDCRKNVKIQTSYLGSYRRHLTKGELNKAGFFAAQIICSDEIENMRRNQSIQRLNLNVLPNIINKSLKITDENKVDIVYEQCGTERLHCIEENIKPILSINKQQDIPVYIGDRDSYFTERFPHIKKLECSVIPKQKLRSSSELIYALMDIVKEQNNILNFIVTLRKEENGQVFIELLEETGAA